MAHLWLSPASTGEPWQVADLGHGAVVALQVDDTGKVALVAGAAAADERFPRVRPIDDATAWVLLDGTGVTARVNGVGLFTGVRRLRDRDALTLRGARTTGPLYFSAERRLQPQHLGAQPPARRCPRCRRGFEQPQQVAVACPTCGVLYHHDADASCWSGPADAPFEHCFACGALVIQPGDFQWTPLAS